MNPQTKTQVQAGLDLIRMGNRMIASAEISEADVREAFRRAQDGDTRLWRQLSQKSGYAEVLLAVYGT